MYQGKRGGAIKMVLSSEIGVGGGGGGGAETKKPSLKFQKILI